MASFLSQIQKQSIDAALDRLHETYASDIYVYIEKQNDVPDNNTYNALYASSNIQNVASYSKILTRHVVSARVKYLQNQIEDSIDANLPISKGRVRIKVSPEDYEKIKICTKIEISDNFYIVDSDPSIEGMFSDNYYTVFLIREN